MLQLDFDGSLIKNNLGLSIQRTYCTNKAALESCEKLYNLYKLTPEEATAFGWSLVSLGPRKVREFAEKEAVFWDTLEELRLFKRLLDTNNISYMVVSMNNPECLLPWFDRNRIVTGNFVWDRTKWKVYYPKHFKATLAEAFNVRMLVGDSARSDQLAALNVRYGGGTVFAPAGSSLASAMPEAHTYDTLTRLGELVLECVGGGPLRAENKLRGKDG